MNQFFFSFGRNDGRTMYGGVRNVGRSVIGTSSDSRFKSNLVAQTSEVPRAWFNCVRRATTHTFNFFLRPLTTMSVDLAPSGEDLKTGPFGILYDAVKGNTQVLVNVRNNHKILGRVKAYDRHMNLCVFAQSFTSLEYCCFTHRRAYLVCVFKIAHLSNGLLPLIVLCSSFQAARGCQRNVD